MAERRMALYKWENLPHVEAEIDEWDLMDQLIFIEEWPLEEQRLEGYIQEGYMTNWRVTKS